VSSSTGVHPLSLDRANQGGGLERYNDPMQASEFVEAEFFRAIAASGARALWIHVDDIAVFNTAVEPQGLFPTRTPDEARGRGRYVLENDERVDVLVARTVPTVDGIRVAFDEVWLRRRALEVSAGVTIAVPTLDDLILTKRFGGRPKDLEDIRLLEALRREQP
jgi:hypothetical protein